MREPSPDETRCVEEVRFNEGSEAFRKSAGSNESARKGWRAGSAKWEDFGLEVSISIC